jgi:hypothetical protein
MKCTKRLFAGIAAFVSVLGGGSAANGQGPAPGPPVHPAPTYKSEEYLLMGDAIRGAGEPVIVINPKNLNNIIVGAMANLHYVEGAPLGVGQERISVESRVKYRNTPGASISRYAITDDRGRTWRFIEDPFRDYFKMNGTADAFVGAGADGTLFIGAMNFFPLNATPEMLELEKEPRPGLLFGATDIAWSHDEGKTWSSPPVHVMGQYNKLEDYGPGVKPEFIGKTPYDRPYLVTDQSTGTIYIPGNGQGGEPSHRKTFFRASHDDGKSWGPIYSYDAGDYPQGGGASRPSAAHGVLGLAYVASSVPANAGAKCPCLVFGASRDEGKTFERHVVQSELPPQPGFGGMGSPQLAADPSHPGRFAIMKLTPGNAEMQVFLTDDYGKTWKGPVPAGRVPGATMTKPDMAYSPRGALAVMWLAVYPDTTYSAWSAISHDGGSEFSPPLQVSHAPSPSRLSIKQRGNNWDGDDLSSLVVDSDFVHIVWADGRAGFLGAWYARISIANY